MIFPGRARLDCELGVPERCGRADRRGIPCGRGGVKAGPAAWTVGGRARRRPRTRLATLLLVLSSVVSSCGGRDAPLTAEKAEEIVRAQMFQSQPVYAEVPQRVSYGPSSPRDAFDELSLRTLRNLEEQGYVRVKESSGDDTVTWVAETTEKGFPLLGTVASARGPAFRAKIADRRLEGIRGFVRHPEQPDVGRAEIIWRIANPTPFYELFETKRDKPPLDEPFFTVVSIHRDRGVWQVRTLVD